MTSQSSLPPPPQDLTCWTKDELLPRFMYDDYPEAAQDVVDFYFSYYFWDEWKNKPGSEEGIKARAERKAIAKMHSLLHTGNMKSTFEDALIIQLHDAQNENWMADIGDGMPEIATMSELLGLALDRERVKRPDGGMFYEYKKTLQMLKAIEQTALAAEAKGGLVGERAKEKVAGEIRKMITTPDISCKIRESGGPVEHILTGTDADDVTKTKLVHEILKDITDPNVTVLEFRSNNRERMGKAGKTIHSAVPGDLYLLGNREIIVIESRSPSQTTAIERKLKGMVSEFSPRDGTQMLKRMHHLIQFSATHKTYAMKDTKLVDAQDGVRMMTPNSYARVCQDTVIRSKEVIDQYVEVSDKPLYILIDRLTASMTPQDMRTFIEHAFKVSVKDMPILFDQITAKYKVPMEVKALWPERDIKTLLYLDEHNTFGLFVCV